MPSDRFTGNEKIGLRACETENKGQKQNGCNLQCLKEGSEFWRR